MSFRDPEVELREAQAKRAALYEKWSRLGLLEGIDDRIVAENTAVLLENVYEYATSKPGREALVETGTFSGANAGYDWSRQDGTAVGNDISPYLQYLMPLVRRVYPNLIANDLVGVQPMNAPVGLVFYLKYRYTGLVDNDAIQADSRYPAGRRTEVATAKGQTAPGTEYANFIGNTWSIDPYYSLQTVFRESLGSGAITTTVGLGGVITLSNGTNSTVANAAPVVANSGVVQRLVLTVSDGGAPAVTDTITATLAPTATPGQFVVVSATGADPNTVVTVNGAPRVDVVYNADGTLQAQPNNWAAATDNITVSDIAGSGTAAAAVTAVSIVVTYDYNMEGNSQLPEIELQVDSYPVQAKTRKLRTKWTIEAQQDLQKMHNVDAEAELTALVSNEIVAEIDREIINDLIVNAAIRVTYDYSTPFIVGGIVSGLTAGQQAITGVTSFDDRNKALFYQILEVSNQIYRQSLRGAGNWIVTSPEIAAKLESLLEFKPEPDIQRNQYNLGIVFSGTLNGQFRVYKDPLFPTDLILVGYKGNSFFDAGFFYCPYIPVELTQTIQDPNTFNHVRGVLTRYGKVLVENGARLYGVIRVQNLKAVGADVLPGSNVTTTPHVSTDGLQDSLNATDLI